MSLPPNVQWFLDQDPFAMFCACALGVCLLVVLSQPPWTRKRK